jgi:hypothetical protein
VGLCGVKPATPHEGLMIFGGVLGLFSFQSFFFVGEVSVISFLAK